MKLTNTYLGYTDKLNPMQKAKAEKILDDYIRSKGIVYQNKSFILTRLQEEFTPTIEENYTHYNPRTDDYTKPKTVYRLEKQEDGYTSRYEINKTLYNFAEYLINNNLLEESAINNRITAENERIQAEQQKQLEIEQKLKAEQEAQEKARKDFENWVDNEINNYNNEDKFNLAKEIYLAELGQYNPYQLKKLLVFIDNIDNELCRAELKLWLHCGNKTSKKVFFHITGIKLHSTDKETQQILDTITSKDFTGMLPYKIRQKHDKVTETFYKLITIPEVDFQEVRAEPINKYGLNMFLENYNNQWILSESKSGCRLTSGNTKEQVFEQLKSFIDNNGQDKINSMIDNMINKYGISPKYREAEAV